MQLLEAPRRWDLGSAPRAWWLLQEALLRQLLLDVLKVESAAVRTVRDPDSSTSLLHRRLLACALGCSESWNLRLPQDLTHPDFHGVINSIVEGTQPCQVLGQKPKVTTEDLAGEDLAMMRSGLVLPGERRHY